MNGRAVRSADAWTARERRVLDRLVTPRRIQAFLDDLAYSADPVYRSPRSVLRDRRAHCLDGALFGAAALRRLGHPPLLVDLRAERDDDHVLAVYRVERCWGAISKSNFAGLRHREPVHRTLRELAMTYFELYYNLDREKTLRAYSRAFDLRRFDALGWERRDEPLEEIVARLDASPHTSLLTGRQLAALGPVDERSYRAGLLGADLDGVYRPAG